MRELKDTLRLLPRYFGVASLFFGFYFLQSSHDQLLPGAPWVRWVLDLVVGPFLVAGLAGTLGEQCRRVVPVGLPGRAAESGLLPAFVRNGVRLYLPFLGIALLALIVAFAVVAVFAIVGGTAQAVSPLNKVIIRTVLIPFAVIKFGWQVALAAEGQGMAKALGRGFRTLLYSGPALGLALGLVVLSAGDAFLGEQLQGHVSGNALLRIAACRAAILGLAAVYAYAAAVAVYRATQPAVFGEPVGVMGSDVPAGAAPPPGDLLGSACPWLALFAFVPGVHLLAWFAGRRVYCRTALPSLRGLMAWTLGVFFTLVYALALAGHWLPAPKEVPEVGPGFLSEAEPALTACAEALAAEDLSAARAELAKLSATTPLEWTADAAAGLIALQAGKVKEAAPALRRALSRTPAPDRAEFFYFYGQALLESDQHADAAAQFAQALKLNPKLAAAHRQQQLLQNLCQPGRIEKAIWYIVILLLLFSMHECAHAYAAWKLGDDTAKNLGRISLNPLAHLDLFGSVILPAILVWRESSVVFGWAKPVPVNPAKFRDERAGQMIVSFAGPAVNVGMAMVCFLLLLFLGLAARVWQPDLATWNLAAPFGPVSVIGNGDLRWLAYAIMFLKQMLFTGLVLGCFNLIPVPPLDGSWILSGILPPRGRLLFEKVRPYGVILFLVLVITPALDVFLAVPVAVAWGILKVTTGVMGLQ